MVVHLPFVSTTVFLRVKQPGEEEEEILFSHGFKGKPNFNPIYENLKFTQNNNRKSQTLKQRFDGLSGLTQN